MTKKVSVEDKLDAYDLLARYCFFVDEGDQDAFADLWTEDGEFAGVSPETIRGREGLRGVPLTSIAGGCRHKLVNLIIEYGDSENDMIVRGYNFVTSWMAGGAAVCNAVVKYHLVRRGDGWKIRSNQARLLVGPGHPGGLPPGFPYAANQPTRWPEL